MSSDSVITALGFGKAADRAYHQVVGQSGRELVSIAQSVLRTPEELMRDLAPLVERGIAQVEDSRLFVLTPAEAVVRMVEISADSAAAAHARLQAVGRALPHLTASNVRPADGDVESVQPVDGEISSGGQPVELLAALIRGSTGDLLWLRPDQFRKPREDAMAQLVGEQIQRGRRSRAIYPVRALHEAADTLAQRAGVGEEIRLLPQLPTRMFIIGSTHVILGVSLRTVRRRVADLMSELGAESRFQAGVEASKRGWI